jgi:hypothetical protein
MVFIYSQPWSATVLGTRSGSVAFNLTPAGEVGPLLLTGASVVFQTSHQTNKHIPLSARTSVIVFRGKTSLSLELADEDAKGKYLDTICMSTRHDSRAAHPIHTSASCVASARPFHLPQQGPLNATTAGAFQHSPPRLALDLN